METILVKNYIDLDKMESELFQILKEVRDSMTDEENEAFMEENYPDDVLKWRAMEMSWKCNDDMNKYLHLKSRDIYGNFNNVDYDYPYHVYGKVEYNRPLVDEMVRRLDNGDESEQSQKDREWIVDWFFETFGTYNIKYNFESEIAETMYVQL